MRIAQIAPLWERVPPELYGGTELVVSNLTEELVKRGHEVTLFASGDSVTKAKLVSVYPRALYRDGILWTDKTYHLLNIANAMERADQFDIIHNHSDFMTLYFSNFVKTPIVHTIHRNLPKKGEKYYPILEKYKNSNFITISNSQRTLPWLNYVTTVYNGTDINKYKFNDSPKDYLLWLGRICDIKGTFEAVKVAKKLKMKLILVGKLDYLDEDYYNKKIKPNLNEQIQYLGEVSEEKKIVLLGNAKALLNPIKWMEPFGLVMPEAMACGTPVIAFDIGSVPEIVVNKKTGFIVKNIDEMVKAVKRIDEIKRRDCRKHVEKNFTIQKMVDTYLKAYKKVLNK